MSQQTTIDWEDVRRRAQASERGTHAALRADENAMQSIFDARAKRLATRHTEAIRSQDERSLLLFRIGDARYALELKCIKEVGPLRRSSIVPGGPPTLFGVVSHHGEVRSVIDSAVLLGGSPTPPTSEGFFVRLGTDDQEMLLRVDQLDQVIHVPSDDISSTQEMDIGLPNSFCIGFTRDRMVILDSAALISEAAALGLGMDEHGIASTGCGDAHC